MGGYTDSYTFLEQQSEARQCSLGISNGIMCYFKPLTTAFKA